MTSPPALRVVIFDDVVAARGEQFHIPGLDVAVFPHADDAVRACDRGSYDVVFMDFAMGRGRLDGSHAIAELRRAGFRGTIIGISSDPAANAAMRAAGADDALDSKAHLRSYLVHIGGKLLAGG
ncbi:MAG TPA: response regulator [Kofleriaceae bacterium]|jgi:CheY-like chemotaxis protein|nr:response regulator [Kofleriaceae bacterium]HMG52730.1 response regulator [Kofleriaceae bacterium]